MKTIIIIILVILVVIWYLIGFIINYTPKAKQQEIQSISNKEFEEFLKSGIYKRILELEHLPFYPESHDSDDCD